MPAGQSLIVASPIAPTHPEMTHSLRGGFSTPAIAKRMTKTPAHSKLGELATYRSPPAFESERYARTQEIALPILL